MKISVKEMADRYAASIEKTWSHDRLTTVGASEVFSCKRKVSYAKSAATPDPDYVDGYGAKMRGDLIENHFWEPAVRSQRPDGTELLYAGTDQQTLVDGYLSATSDGVLVGVARDCLAHMGIPDIGSDTLVVECKSIDPRVSLNEAKAEHSGQTQCQMGLIRHCTSLRPEYALISYTDASFLDKITEFAVKFDPAIYAAAQARAKEIMLAEDPAKLAPEGKIAGGADCKYCPFQSRCSEASVNSIPREVTPIGANAMTQLACMVEEVRAAERDADEATLRKETVRHKIKEFLVELNTRKITGNGFNISWSSIKGRKSFDRKAAEKAGLNLSLYDRDGDPSERLTITS